MLDPKDRVVTAVPGEIERPGIDVAPDVIVYELDDDDDAGLLGELVAIGPSIVLLDDARGSPGSSALRAGARAVLPRDAHAEELRAAVAAVALGYAVLPPELTSTASPTPGAEAPVITGREREVLALLARGLPNKTIAARLRISEHTVKFHVGSILSKLGAASRTEAVTTGVRLGLIMI